MIFDLCEILETRTWPQFKILIGLHEAHTWYSARQGSADQGVNDNIIIKYATWMLWQYVVETT